MKDRKPNAGSFGGPCYRTACQQLGAVYWNRGTYQFYCQKCAELINGNCHDIEPLLALSEKCSHVPQGRTRLDMTDMYLLTIQSNKTMMQEVRLIAATDDVNACEIWESHSPDDVISLAEHIFDGIDNPAYQDHL